MRTYRELLKSYKNNIGEEMSSYILDNGLIIVLNKTVEDPEQCVAVNLRTIFPSEIVGRGYAHLIEHLYVEPVIKKHMKNSEISINAHVGHLNTLMNVIGSFSYHTDKNIGYKPSSERVIKSIHLLDDYLSDFIKGFSENKINQDRIDQEKSVILAERRDTGTTEINDWIGGVSDIFSILNSNLQKIENEYNLKHIHYAINSNIIGSENDINDFNLKSLELAKSYIFNKENTVLVIEGNKEFFDNEKFDIERVIESFSKTIDNFDSLKNYPERDREFVEKSRMILDHKAKESLKEEVINDSFSICKLSDSFNFIGLDTSEPNPHLKCLFIKMDVLKDNTPEIIKGSDRLLNTIGFMSYIWNQLFFELRTKYRGFYSMLKVNFESAFSYQHLVKKNFVLAIPLTTMESEPFEELIEDLTNGNIKNLFKNKVLEIINDPVEYEKMSSFLIERYVFSYSSFFVTRYVDEVFGFSMERREEFLRPDIYWDQMDSYNSVKETLESNELKELILELVDKIHFYLVFNA